MKARGGFILLEVSVVYIILTLGLVALIPLYVMAVRANTMTQYVKTATQLSLELMEEVRLRRWDENTPMPAKHIAAGSTLGVDSGETAGDKRTFDDIDDFNGWVETTALTPLLQPIPGFSQFSRQVTVSYVNSSNTVVVGPTDIKWIHVCTSVSKMDPVCLDSLVTNR